MVGLPGGADSVGVKIFVGGGEGEGEESHKSFSSRFLFPWLFVGFLLGVWVLLRIKI